MATKKDFRGVFGVINNGKQYPVAGIVKSNPGIAATISKLTQGRERPTFDNSGNRSVAPVNRQDFENISADVAEKAQDSESIMQLFPEMELGAQILVSSIISPKDMSGGDVIYTAPNGLMTPEVIAALIERTREYLDGPYNIKSLMPKILREILFESGSYPVAVIPESSIDDMINGSSKISMEGMSEFVDSNGIGKSLGVLGSPISKRSANNFANEAYQPYVGSGSAYDSMLTYAVEGVAGGERKTASASLLHIIDNPFVLRLPEASMKMKEGRVKSIMKGKTALKSKAGLGFEAYDNNMAKLNDSQLQALIYKSRARNHEAVVRVKTKGQASRQTIGAPLIMRLPAESVIPVHVPGNEEKHIGFFVLIDIEGNPINRNTPRNHFGDLQGKLNSASNSMGSYMLERANKAMTGGCQHLTIENATKLYTDIVEADLNERLRNGVYGNNISVARNEEVYRIMLARALSNQTTQLLYLPAELVTYFAYKYDKNGIGKSLLDDMRILNSLRAMMMFSRVMASLKNSIGRTEVAFKLDERDPDPMKTIEVGIHELAKTRQQYFPLGMNSPTDLVDWIQRSGFEYTFEGHPKIPDMKMQFNEKNSNYAKPDTELDEELKKRSIMGIGLSPEMVDNAFGSEFATTVVSNNLLMAKRVTQIQEHFSPQLTDHARKVIANDGALVAALREIIMQNYDKLEEIISKEPELKDAQKPAVVEFLLEYFLTTFELSLPSPNSITLENQLAAFNAYSEGLDKALDAWLNDQILNPAMAGQIGTQVEAIKGIIKGYYLRKWMADNNFFNELTELTTKDENGAPGVNLMEIQGQHIAGIVRSVVHLLKGAKGMADAADKDIGAITHGQGLDAFSGSSSSSSDTGGSSDFDFGGGDGGLGPLPDFGGGGDTDATESPDATEKPDGFDESPPDDPTRGGPNLPTIDNGV